MLDTPKGMQACGVLVAPSAGVWRARIVTYPKVPWMIPGGRGTIKFSGITLNDAESRAVAYIHAHCAERGWAWSDVVPLRRKGDGMGMPERRKRRSLPIRYLEAKATPPASPLLTTVVNVSEGGLFLADPNPWPPGTILRLEIEIWGSIAAFDGRVAWTRTQLEPGRPRGMGVVLDDPPAVWVSFARSLP
jgi:hypothetical protein